MQVRDARPEDVDAIVDVLRRSITALCAADHNNDPAILAEWLANKQPEVVAEWLAAPNQKVLVVDEAAKILAVGAVRVPDEILLNYVAPEARLQGVSTALLVEMEQRLKRAGARAVQLMSTETARRFYQSRGYRSQSPTAKYGMTSYRMWKELAQ